MSPPNPTTPDSKAPPATPSRSGNIKQRLRGSTAAAASARARPSSQAAPRTHRSSTAAPEGRIPFVATPTPAAPFTGAPGTHPSFTGTPTAQSSFAASPGTHHSSVAASAPGTGFSFTAAPRAQASFEPAPQLSHPATPLHNAPNRAPPTGYAAATSFPSTSSNNHNNDEDGITRFFGLPPISSNNTNLHADNQTWPAKPQASDYSVDRFAKQHPSGALTLVTPTGRRYRRYPHRNVPHPPVPAAAQDYPGDDDDDDDDDMDNHFPFRAAGSATQKQQRGNANPTPGNGPTAAGGMITTRAQQHYDHPPNAAQQQHHHHHHQTDDGSAFDAPFPQPRELASIAQQQSAAGGLYFNNAQFQPQHQPQPQYPGVATAPAQPQIQSAPVTAASGAGTGAATAAGAKKAVNVFTDEEGVKHTMAEGMNYSDDFEDWPATPFVALEEYIKSQSGEIDELDRLYLMGIQAGIGLGIQHYKNTLLNEYTDSGKLWSWDMEFEKPEDRTREQQAELVRAIDAMDICAAMRAANEHILNRHNVAVAARELSIDLRPDLTKAKAEGNAAVAASAAAAAAAAAAVTAVGTGNNHNWPMRGAPNHGQVANLSAMAGTPTIGGLDTSRLDGVAGATANRIMQNQAQQHQHQLQPQTSLNSVFNFQAGSTAGNASNVNTAPVRHMVNRAREEDAYAPRVKTPALTETASGRAVIQMPPVQDGKKQQSQKKKNNSGGGSNSKKRQNKQK